MPPSDYNKKKQLEVTTQNDSGTTQDKAQPVLVKGEEFVKEQDGFEDGDFTNSPTWNVEHTDATATVQGGTVINGSQTLELSRAGDGEIARISHDRGSNDSISDGDVYKFFINTGNTDFAEYELYNDGDSDTISVIFNSGDIEIGSSEDTGGTSNIITTYENNTVYEVELKIIPSESNAVCTIKDNSGNVIASGSPDNGTTGASNLENVRLRGGGPVYFDDVSYSTTTVNSITESDTGTGDIIIDFTNIAGPEDIAVYDQNGNLLDYEIEDLDTTAETGVLWCYNSWTRDDSVQAQIAYGNNSANEDRSMAGTGSNPWENGQNAIVVQHLQDDPLTATDSTANNNDGTINGSVSTTGLFNRASDYDGADDVIVIAGGAGLNNDGDIISNYTVVQWINADAGGEVTTTNTFPYANLSGSGKHTFRTDPDSPFQVKLEHNDGSWTGVGATTLATEEWHQLIGTFDSSTVRFYVNSALEGSANKGNMATDVNEGVFIGANQRGNHYEGLIDETRIYHDEKDSGWIQADYDASPKGGQVYFSQQAAEPTLTFNGATTTANTNASGGTTSLSGSTTAGTNTANATGSGATIFIEPDFATLSANASGSGETINISGQTTVMIAQTASASGSGVATLDLKPNLLLGAGASASGTGGSTQLDRLSGTVDVEGQPTSGVDVNVVDKTNNILYETTTDSNGDWVVDSGNGVLYQVAYLFDDGTTFYGDAEESDTT